MAETHASLTAKLSGTSLRARVELVGIPHQLSGIAAGGDDGDGATAYSVNPISLVSARYDEGGYTAAQLTGFVYTLQSLSFNGETIDPITGKTTIGSLTFSFIDAPIPSGAFTGWGSIGDSLFAEVFAAHKASRVTSLASSVTATATSITVGAALTAGTAYFLGAETLVASTAGPAPANVVRGLLATRGAAAGSLARAHTASTDATPYPDVLYDRPRVWLNREVNLYFAYDHADIDKTEEQGPFRFRISAYPEYQNGVWTIRADNALSFLKKPVARGAYRAKLWSVMPFGSVSTKAWAKPLEEKQPQPSKWGDAALAANDRVWFDIDGEAVEAWITRTAAQETEFEFYAEGRPRLGTKKADIGIDAEIREVVPTDANIDSPRIGHVPDAAGYSIANLVESEHPVVAFLNMLLSRDGDMTNVETAGTDNCYDILGPPWGIAWPADRVNLSSFEDFINETKDVTSFPRFRLGHDGEFSLLEWWETEVAQFLGVALVMNDTGDLELIRVGDVFALDLDTTVTTDLTHIERGYHGYAMNSRGVTSKITLKYVAGDGTKVTTHVNSVYVEEMYPDEAKVTKWESEGATERTKDVIEDRAAATIIKEEQPYPVATFVLPWTRSAGANQVKPGTVLEVTDAGMPDIKNGGYGVTSEMWVALGVSYDLRLNSTNRTMEAAVKVKAIRAATQMKHFAPSGITTGWVLGTLTFTLGANNFTPTTGLGSYVPNADVKAFGSDGAQGGAGLYVRVLDSDGVAKSDNELEISSISYAGNTITLDKAPDLGGGGFAHAATDILTLHPWTAGIKTAVAAGTIHTDQDAYAYQAGSDWKIAADDADEWGA